MRNSWKITAYFIPLCSYALISCQAAAQISSPSADFRDSLAYDIFPGKDPYFVFYTPDASGLPVKGSLEAAAPGGTGPFDFAWSRWDTAGASFQPYVSELSADVSVIGDLDPGCYSVRITSVDTDTLFRAWVFTDDPLVEVLKDENGKIIPYNYTCDYLVLNGTVRADTLVYYDLATNEPDTLVNGMRFEWTSDNDDIEIFGATTQLDIFIYNDPNYEWYRRPPTRDTRFTLTGVDSFGLSRSDEVLYESVHVRARFTVLTEDEENPGVWTPQENPSGEAPLEVRFRNLSENGVEFEWTLVDSAKAGAVEDIVTYDPGDSVMHTYYYPGYYYPKMTAYSVGGSAEGCPDFFPFADTNRIEIEVYPSDLDAPNVFTPDGDGVNEVFRVNATSLKDFRITIYNRQGRKVYEHEQTEEKLEWEGWDGTLFGNGKRFARSGIYYYVIEALGWDAVHYRGREPYTGFVYLIRPAE